MPKYKLLAKHFINNTIHEEGEIVEYDGKPGNFMERVEEEVQPAPKASGKKGGRGAVFSEGDGEE